MSPAEGGELMRTLGVGREECAHAVAWGSNSLRAVGSERCRRARAEAQPVEEQADHAGTQTAEESAREPVRLALLGPGPTGTFSSAAGPLPW